VYLVEIMTVVDRLLCGFREVFFGVLYVVEICEPGRERGEAGACMVAIELCSSKQRRDAGGGWR
jgi:hypothetical protein